MLLTPPPHYPLSLSLSPHTSPSHSQQSSPRGSIIHTVHATLSPALLEPLHACTERWLKPQELINIFTYLNAINYIIPTDGIPQFAHLSSISLLSPVAPSRPASGSVYLFSKHHCKRWRKDDYIWKGIDGHVK